MITLIEMGPGAGSDGGTVVCQGTVAQVMDDSASIIGPYLRQQNQPKPARADLFERGSIRLVTGRDPHGAAT